MRVNAQFNVPAKNSQTRPSYLSLLLFQTVSARQRPCPGQVFSYSNRTKNHITVLAIPEFLMKFPASLHPLRGSSYKLGADAVKSVMSLRSNIEMYGTIWSYMYPNVV